MLQVATVTRPHLGRCWAQKKQQQQMLSTPASTMCKQGRRLTGGLEGGGCEAARQQDGQVALHGSCGSSDEAVGGLGGAQGGWQAEAGGKV